MVGGFSDLSVSGTTQSVTGLTAGTAYAYRVRTVGSGSTSANSNVITATLPARPTAVVSGGGTICTGGTLPNVTIAFTGAGTYDFTYTDGTTSTPVTGYAGASYTLTNAPAGTYAVTALSDANGPAQAGDMTGSATVTVEALPVVASPTAGGITESSAILGASVTSYGGTAATRGTVFRTTTGVTATDNALAEGGTATGAYTHTRTGLAPQTRYFYAGYATTTTSCTGLSAEGSFYTLSNPPSAQASGLAVTEQSSVQASLNWNPATFPGSGATQNGYLLVYSTGTPAMAGAPNGLAPASAVSNGTIVNTASTSATITGLSAGSTYNFLLVPYTWDGTNPETYHYLTTGAPTLAVSITNTTYTWVNGNSGPWTTASNWTPAGVPGRGRYRTVLRSSSGITGFQCDD